MSGKKAMSFWALESVVYLENSYKNFNMICNKCFLFYSFIITGLFDNGRTHMPDAREHVKPPPEQQFTWTLSSRQRSGFLFRDDNPGCRKYGTGNSCSTVRRGSYNNKKENKRSKNRNPRGTGVFNIIFGILSSDLDFATSPRLHVSPSQDNATFYQVHQYWHSVRLNNIFIEGLNHNHLLWSPVYSHVTTCLFVHLMHTLWRSLSLQTLIIDYRNRVKNNNFWPITPLGSWLKVKVIKNKIRGGQLRCFIVKEDSNWKFSRSMFLSTRFLDFSFTEYWRPVKSNKQCIFGNAKVYNTNVLEVVCCWHWTFLLMDYHFGIGI